MAPRHPATRPGPAAEAWFRWTPARASPRLRLLCLPPAGAGAGFFRGCAAWFADDVELVAYRPRGRDARLDQPAPHTFADYLADAAAALPELASVPVALWGHSMGGLVALELARAVAPQLIVVSAHAVAPQRHRHARQLEIGRASCRERV